MIITMFFSLVQAEGLSQSEKMTFDRQLKGCDEDEPFACLRIGDYYYIGRGLEKDISTAESYYEKGAALMKAKCEKGEKNHCTYYAGMLQSGKGVEQNVEKSYEIYHDLCLKGDCESCGRLYYLNSQGLIFSDSPYLMCSEPVYTY